MTEVSEAKNRARDAFLWAMDEEIAARRAQGQISSFELAVWENQRNRVAVFLGESPKKYRLKNSAALMKEKTV